MSASNIDSGKVRIGVIVNPQYAYGRNAIRGISQYIEERQPNIEIDYLIHSLDDLIKKSSQYDGFISVIYKPILEQIPPHIPQIRIGAVSGGKNSTTIPIDNQRIGGLAAETLFNHGVVSYGYYDGSRNDDLIGNLNSSARLSGFLHWLTEHDQSKFDTSHDIYKPRGTQQLDQWLLSLPKPVGIFAYNDIGALEVAEACGYHDISIPKEVAIIGVDNDSLLCTLNAPHLSSIDSNVKQVAFNALESLIETINGRELNEHDIKPALPFAILRTSTGHRHCDDSSVIEALRLIEQYKSEKPKLADLAQHVGCSLRTLEMRFKDQLGTTIQHEVQRAQLNEAKRLIRTTDLTIEEVASQINWEAPSLHHAFKRETKQSPGSYKELFSSPQRAPIQVGKLQSELNQSIVNIGIILPMIGKVHYEILRGIENYCQKNQDIRLSLRIDTIDSIIEAERHDLSEGMPFSHCDGFVTSTNTILPREILGQKPIITIDHEREQDNCCSISVDNRGAGELAAKHYLGKGYSHFAYCDFSPEATSQGNQVSDTRSNDRFAGFHDTLIDHGIGEEQIEYLHYEGIGSLDEQLNGLARPTALYAFNDALASLVSQACTVLGISIPSDIALVGTDNHEFLCRLNNPMLSSIDINFARAGYDAAEHLYQWIRNGAVPHSEPLSIEARHVIERASSNTLGTEDSAVHATIEFIKQHFAEEISIDDITTSTGLSRRSVELRFKKALRHTILEELHTTRIKKAADLLTATSLTVNEVANQCGFKNAARFSQVFKLNMHATPKAYRDRRSGLI